LPALTIEALRAERALAVLRGRAPGTEEAAIAEALRTPAPVPSLAITAAPALPADLVRLRPDVAQAEAQAMLRAAEVGISRSNLLPQLNLTGSISVADNIIGHAAPERSASLSLTPFITIPLFDWGRRFAEVDASDARFDGALVQYRDTVNGAVNEAANALTALDQGAKRLAAARAAESAAEASARGARAAYDVGIRSLSEYLLTLQQLIDARLTRIDAEAQQARAAIAVYRAFGGGPRA
jgi:outer membrane protein TolC